VLVTVFIIASKAHTEHTRRRDAAWLQRVTQSGAAAENDDPEDDEIDRQLEEWAGNGRGNGADDEFDANLAEWAREADEEDERAAEKEPFMAP